jgi:hypothetical protein
MKIDSIEEMIPEGALKKERAKTGRKVKTDLSKTIRPSKERKRLLHPDNLFIKRAITGSQKAKRLGSPSIGSPI